MKVTTSPSLSVISLSTALSRSSNSPRYLAPATIDDRSSAISRLSLRLSGTSPSTMRRARPSTMAVLPTPGSPISTGLFLVRRDSTWITRRISSSRPMTGSISPARAASVRSRPYFSSAWYCSSGFWLVTRWLPRTWASAASRSSRSTPSRSARASSRCSVDRYSSCSSRRAASAASSRRGQLAAHAGVAAVGLGQALDRGFGLGAHLVGRLAHLGQDREHDALVLAQERDQQVVGRDLGVGVGPRRLDGVVQRLLGLEGPAIRIESQGNLHKQ